MRKFGLIFGGCLLGLVALFAGSAMGDGFDDRVSGAPSGTYSAGGTDVALLDGGTNKSLTPVAGGVCWVDADSFEETAAGSSGQVLQSNGTSAPSWVSDIAAPGNVSLASGKKLLWTGTFGGLGMIDESTYCWYNSSGVVQRCEIYNLGQVLVRNGANNGYLGEQALTFNATSINPAAGTMANPNVGYLAEAWQKYSWTNAQVVALGASTTGDITVGTLQANMLVDRALVRILTAAGGVTTLTVSCGRTSATYVDWVLAGDAKAAANTVYGDAVAEIGAGLVNTGGVDTTAKAYIDDLPSVTATTAVKCHFISTGANLSSVTTSTGAVYLRTAALP